MFAAPIWSGASTASDWFLLIGAILAGLAAIVYLVPAAPKTTATTTERHDGRTYGYTAWAAALLALSVCSVAIGWLAL